MLQRGLLHVLVVHVLVVPEAPRAVLALLSTCYKTHGMLELQILHRRSSAPLVLVWMVTEAMGRKRKEVVMVLVVGSDGSIRFLS